MAFPPKYFEPADIALQHIMVTRASVNSEF